MSELKPGAFRVWDNKEKAYKKDQGWGDNFVLSQDGTLSRFCDEGDQAGLFEIDPDRYQVELWARTHDKAGVPAYENDVFAVKIHDVYQPCVLVYGQGNRGFYDLKTLSGELVGREFCVCILRIGTIHDDPAVLEEKARKGYQCE